MSADLESCWALVRPAAPPRPPVTSANVLTALDELAKITRKSMIGDAADQSLKEYCTNAWMDSYRRSAQVFGQWCKARDLPAVPTNDPSELRGALACLVRDFHPDGLSRKDFAKRLCQVWWVRDVGLDLWGSLLVDAEHGWPPNFYPYRVELPRSAWLAADGVHTSDDWIIEPAAMSTHYYASGHIPFAEILSHQFQRPQSCVGELPGIMVLLWLHGSDSLGTYIRRIEGRAKELHQRATYADIPDASPLGDDACEHEIDPDSAFVDPHGTSPESTRVVFRCIHCGRGGWGHIVFAEWSEIG